MTDNRNGVLVSEQIVLRTLYEDSLGNLVDPDAPPEIYIYDESFTSEQIEAEYQASIFTGLGPFAATRISTGYYEYVFTVPSGASAGTWSDLWISDKGSVESHEVFVFQVIAGLTIKTQSLKKNQLIVIELDESIADEDGNLLGHDVQITFSTIYDPLYASVDLVRAEVGPWIDFIPDDTINLLIHWSSREVDSITPSTIKRIETEMTRCDEIYWVDAGGHSSTPKNLYKYARTQFVIFDTAIRALMLPGAANMANVSGVSGMKRLGDLTIQGPQTTGWGGAGLTKDILNELKKKRDEWWRVVNAGGTIVPGQGLPASLALKGIGDPDRRKAGRMWHDPNKYHYKQPSQNMKWRAPGTRRHRFIFG